MKELTLKKILVAKSWIVVSEYWDLF